MANTIFPWLCSYSNCRSSATIGTDIGSVPLYAQSVQIIAHYFPKKGDGALENVIRAVRNKDGTEVALFGHKAAGSTPKGVQYEYAFCDCGK